MKKILLLFGFILTAIPLRVAAGSNDSALKTKVTQWMNNASGIRFLENKGQMMDMQRKAVNNVLFKAGAGGVNVYVTTDGLSYVFTQMQKHKKAGASAVLNKFPRHDEDDSITETFCRADMELVGADIRKENIIKEGESTDHSDYYYGGVCPDGILNVHSYGKVTIKNIYPGIDWVVHSSKQGLKYDFIVHPGANPSLIRLKYKWTDTPQLQSDGSVKISTPMGNITEGTPISYADDKQVKTTYSVDSNEIHFNVNNYNTTENLTIDPTLIWATYYSGNGETDDVFCMQEDGSNVWITGGTRSPNFPTYNPGNGTYFQGIVTGQADVFIVQFNTAGVLEWATYYGGSSLQGSYNIYSDGVSVWVAGYTSSFDFPVLNPGGGAYFQSRIFGSETIFILQFSTSGVRKWATFYGGSKQDFGYSIQSDGANVWLTGFTDSPDFPTLNPGGGAYFQSTLGTTSGNAFVLKFNTSGVRQWATYYGGSVVLHYGDQGFSINSDGVNVWVTGTTGTQDFPTLNPGGGAYFQGTLAATTYNTFVLKFNVAGVCKWATYYGGSGGVHVGEDGTSINSDGKHVWVTGYTASTNFPTYNPGGGTYFQGTLLSANGDAFILKFDTAGIRKWATYYGGSGNNQLEGDYGTSIKSDGTSLWVCGATSSTDFPTLNPGCGFYQDTLGRNTAAQPSDDMFILQFDTTGIREWGTYYGTDIENDYSYACSDGTNVFVAGDAGYKGYPTFNPGNGAYYCDTVTIPVYAEYVIVGKFSISGNALAVNPMVSVCRGDSITLSASGATYYSWSPPTGLSATNIANPVASPTVTTTYTVIGADTGACAGTHIDSIKVVVDTFSGFLVFRDSSICFGNSVTLIAEDGKTYKWSTGSTTSSISITNDTATATYSVIIDNGACRRDTDDVKINLNPLPIIRLGGNNEVCIGEKDTLTISGGNKYVWSNGNTSSTLYTGNLNTDTSFTVTTYNSFGCSHDTTITIHVVPLSVPVITGTLSKCKGGTDTLTVSGGNTYLWSNGNTTITYYTGNLNADTTVTVIAYNSLGCPRDTTFTIRVVPLPVPAVTGTVTKCLGEADTLTVSGGSTYLWSNGSTTNTYYTGNLNADSTFTVTVFNSFGCSHDTVIHIHPDVVNMTACCDAIILAGNDTTLVAKGNTNKPYQWSPQVNCLNPPLCDSVKVSPNVTTTYTVTLTDSLGCQVEQVLTIIVEAPCFNFTIPNVFTPNNAGPLGLNNVFYIKTYNLDAWSITIYDRWGIEMYNSNNPNAYWAGNTEGGSKAPDGVYYYIINASCQGNSYKKDGFVQLIR